MKPGAATCAYCKDSGRVDIITGIDGGRFVYTNAMCIHPPAWSQAAVDQMLSRPLMAQPQLEMFHG